MEKEQSSSQRQNQSKSIDFCDTGFQQESKEECLQIASQQSLNNMACHSASLIAGPLRAKCFQSAPWAPWAFPLFSSIGAQSALISQMQARAYPACVAPDSSRGKRPLLDCAPKNSCVFHRATMMPFMHAMRSWGPLKGQAGFSSFECCDKKRSRERAPKIISEISRFSKDSKDALRCPVRCFTFSPRSKHLRALFAGPHFASIDSAPSERALTLACQHVCLILIIRKLICRSRAGAQRASWLVFLFELTKSEFPPKITELDLAPCLRKS